MAMGIIVTAFTLFGMLGLVVFHEALDEPMREQPPAAKPKLRARAVSYAPYAARTRKKAA